MANSVEGLDLYARIEPMLCNDEAISSLYGEYLKILDDFVFDSLLDVGCGNGGFLELVGNIWKDTKLKGIDLSPEMVSRTKSRGLDAQAIDLCELDGSYDIITAVFDMVNYLDGEYLPTFLQCISDKLNSGGYFIFDLNSEYGFDEIASGSFTAEEDGKYLVIDSDYDDGIYHSYFTLFTSQGNLYSREDQKITQYYHDVQTIKLPADMKLISVIPIALYADRSDKNIIIIQKKG